MMEASFTARYEPEKTAAAATATATVSFNVRDLRLRTSVTDAAIIDGPSLNGLSLAVEKPGYFVIDFNVPKKDFEFKFHRSVKVAEKPLNLSYTRMQGDARTILNGTLVIDSANQVSVTHVPEAGNMKLKYGYVHRGLTTFEPSYDLGKNSWELAVSRRVYGDDVFRATYETSSKNLGLEWSHSSKLNGSFKILASVNLADEQKMPKLCAETTWDFEMRTPCVFAHRRQWFPSGRESYSRKNTLLPIY